MSHVSEGAILAFFARHGDEVSFVPTDDLQIPDDETVVKGDRGVSLQFLLFHREYLYVCNIHLRTILSPLYMLRTRQLRENR